MRTAADALCFMDIVFAKYITVLHHFQCGNGGNKIEAYLPDSRHSTRGVSSM